MANVFCASGGSNTAPYDTWAKAATSFATALSTASSNGDVIVLQYDGVPSGDAENAADVTYTFAANVSLICSTNSGTSTITPTVMGTANWIGNSTANRSVTFAGAFKVFIYGLTVRTAGATADNIVFSSTDGAHTELESCYLWSGNTASASVIAFGNTSGGANAYTRLKNCTLRFGHASQGIAARGQIVMEGGSVSPDGSAPTTFLSLSTNATSPNFEGVDLSHLGSGTLVGSASNNAPEIAFTRCTLGASYVAMATQTPANLSSATVWIFDCSSGDTHGLIGHHNALGSTVSNTSIYFTSGAAAQSWKIDTTANAHAHTPYLSPWVDLYNSTLSSVTPYIEILRDGSTTAYQDDEVWAEFSAKTTTGVTGSTFYGDRMSLMGTPANQAAGAGTGSWTGEAGSAWSGKCDSGAAFTPAETGHIRGRIVVGEPSITVYMDPQIRS